MAQLADRLVSPPALAEIAAGTGLSAIQLIGPSAPRSACPRTPGWRSTGCLRPGPCSSGAAARPMAAALTGFADQAHLTRWFRRVVGVTPGAYRNSVQDSAPRYR